MLTILMWLWALYRELVGTTRESKQRSGLFADGEQEGLSPQGNGHALGGLSPKQDQDLLPPSPMDSSAMQLSSAGSPDDGPSYHRMRKSRENSDFSTVSGFTSSSACSGSVTTTGSYGSAPSGGDDQHRRYPSSFSTNAGESSRTLFVECRRPNTIIYDTLHIILHEALQSNVILVNFLNVHCCLFA